MTPLTRKVTRRSSETYRDRSRMRRIVITLYPTGVIGLRLEDVDWFVSTGYGLFRREVFEAGVRFDETEPFDREGWGFEDNDLALQMHVRGYVSQCFTGMTYLHRYPKSSLAVMRARGTDQRVQFKRRRDYVLRKWADTPAVANGPLNRVRAVPA